jgi:hypothetical protein
MGLPARLQGLAAVLLLCGVVCAALLAVGAGGRAPAAALVQAMGGLQAGEQVTMILFEGLCATACLVCGGTGGQSATAQDAALCSCALRPA